MFQVGRQLALLNQIPPPDYLLTNHPYGHQHFPNVVGLNIDPNFESWLIEEFEYLDHNIAGSLPRGLIHGDLFYDNLLFEPLDYGTAGLIKKEIKETLNRYEPRISIQGLNCYPRTDENGYEVELEYMILGREDRAVGIDIFLERTR